MLMLILTCSLLYVCYCFISLYIQDSMERTRRMQIQLREDDRKFREFIKNKNS